MKKKKVYIGLGIIAIVIILIVGIIIAKKENDKKKENEKNQEIQYNNSISDSNDSSANQPFIIKSSDANPIEKDNVEIVKVEVLNNYGSLEVSTTLKNNSTESLNGFFIELELLDESGNIITSVATNSEQQVLPNAECTFTSSVVELPNAEKIVNARIANIEKSSTKYYIQNSLEMMDTQANKIKE